MWFTEGSHWINMKPVLETLVDRGHQVTVLVPSSSMSMNSSEPSRFRYEPFNVSVSVEVAEAIMEEFFHFSMYEINHMSYLQIFFKFMDMIKANLQHSLKVLDGVVKSDAIMKKLKEGKYDLLLSDPILVGSDLTAELLGIPLVYSLRFSFANNWERHCGQLPAPPSFVPIALSKFTDKMNFFERVLNFMSYALQDIIIENIWKDIDKYYSEIKGEQFSYKRYGEKSNDDLLSLEKLKLYLIFCQQFETLKNWLNCDRNTHKCLQDDGQSRHLADANILGFRFTSSFAP